MDIREQRLIAGMGALKYGVVGSWKVLPAKKQTLAEVVVWAKREWRLKGQIAINPLNHNYFFMGFEVPEEAMRVMEYGSRVCSGGVMQLEWWSQSSGCKGIRDKEKEVWVRVVGLPLHLWTGENLKKVGDSCGGFIAMDEGTASKTDLLWARILVKSNNNAKSDSVNLIAGNRAYVVQLWWEIRPTIVEVNRKSCSDTGGLAELGEEDDCYIRAKGRVNHEKKKSCKSVRNGPKVVGNQNGMGICVVEECLKNGTTCGGRFQAGDKGKRVFKIDGGNWGRNGQMKNVFVMDPLMDRAGLHLEGATAQEREKARGSLKGPREECPGVEFGWPTGRSSQSNPRYASKGGSKETMGVKNHDREKEPEGEMPTGETRASLASKPSQDQGRDKVYNMRRAKSRKERTKRKGSAGSEEEEEERGEGSCCGASEKETIGGNLPEKTSIDADKEVVRAKDGSLCEVVESEGSVLRGANQAGGYRRGWCRNSGKIKGDLRIEFDEEDVSRAGKKVGEGEVRPGRFDGTRTKPSGRARQPNRKIQEEEDPALGQITGVGRGSNMVWASGRELGRPNVLIPVMGLFYRVALSPVSTIRDFLKEMSLYESSSSKAKPADLEPGVCQEMFSKTGANEVCFGSTGLSSGEGQKGKDTKIGEGNEIGEIAAQEDGYSSLKRYDDKRYSQHSPISISVFGRPLLSGGFSGQGVLVPDKSLVPFRTEEADDRDWGSPGSSFDVGLGYGGDGQRKMKCNFDLAENWKYGSWESSCLVKFSEFLGFPTKGFEKEIMNLLEMLVASQTRGKEKGSQSVSKSERELRRLRSTVNYNGNKSNKVGGRDRGNLLLKLK